MNEKIQAILLKIVVALRKEQWNVAPDWEITLKGEGHVPMTRNVSVKGDIDGEEWEDTIQTTIDLKLESADELTYFPSYTIYAEIYLEGASGKDIANKMDVDVAFTDRDLKDDSKPSTTAKKITRLTDDYVSNEYSDYVNQNAEDIKSYKHGGWKADADRTDEV